MECLGLRDKRVLVTASTRGIGFGVAETLLRYGAVVTINGRWKKSVAAAVERLRGLGRVYGVAADLTVREQAEGLVDRAAELMGGLDGLVYITGPPRPGRFSELGEDDWAYGARLLIYSAIWVTRRALRYLGRGSSIVYLTSVATKEPIPGIALSNTLRIAVHGLAKTLSKELAPHGIRVNTVMPGYIDTDRVRQLAEKIAADKGVSVEEARRMIEEKIPLGRIGEPREIGYVVAFLLSPMSSYITGAAIPVDGGLLSSVF